MNAQDLRNPHKSYFNDFLESCGYNQTGSTSFIDEIAPADEMFHKAIVPGYANVDDAYMAYMQSGKRMLDVAQQITNHCFPASSRTKLSILEFAGGYGRFTRHLVSGGFAPEQVTTSDIYTEAVDWLHNRIGVRGVYSCPSPKDFPLVASFDLIFVGSLFSHLPRNLFSSWLKKLFDMLSPRGVLAFSTHNLVFAAGAGAKVNDEFAYAEFSESDSLSHDIYGMTYVSDRYVRELVAEICGYDTAIQWFHQGMYENQDLYVVSRADQENVHSLNLIPTPIGGATFSTVRDGKVFGFGWGVAPGPNSNPLVGEVMVNNKVIDTQLNYKDSHIETTEIKKYFPHLISEPITYSFSLQASDFPTGAVVKVRLSTKGSNPYDVYLGVIPE